jgi:microcompartment protein CcmL/EutN
MVVAEAAVKRAPVNLRRCHTISPGHFLVVFTGGVGEVEESFAAAVFTAADTLVDHVFLPQLHDQVAAHFAGIRQKWPTEETDWAMGIAETHSVSGAVIAADAACKTAEVSLLTLELGQGIGGKGYLVLGGPLEDIQAALDAAVAVVRKGFVMRTEIIPRPHAEWLALCAAGGLRPPG